VLGCEHCVCRDVGWVVLVVVRFLELGLVGFVCIVNRCGMETESVF
jgi:hypothetical protein